MSTLVIVESPAKARTLTGILGKGFQVEASFGHVRDLPQSATEIPARFKGKPWARLGVDVENGFEPIYVVPKDRKEQIQKLKKALATADTLLLATDEDREGESISWHVAEILKPEVPIQRIVFHEITEEAIRAALEQPRDIDQDLVRAQESRRILDRLFGYELSPVLWKKVRPRLSAGRVQSAAVRLLVERERERRNFRSATWFDAEARFEVEGQAFSARLARLGDQALADGSAFDPTTGLRKEGSRARLFESAAEIDALIAAWERPWQVTAVEEKPQNRQPAPPFTTSTLQQEANRKLRFSARRTMTVAQRLYEGIDLGGDRVGLITYMRTDSVNLAERALAQAEQVVRELYGDEYTTGPRRYKTRTKGAQEAHEAIRPTDLARLPEKMRRYLQDDEYRLYELIWRRAVASQMAPARLRRTSVDILTTPGETVAAPAADLGTFTATGTMIDFPGFLRAYVEGSDDPEAELAEREVLLPALTVGTVLDPRGVETREHVTQPPARYTEASLVKKLEEEGIGRPSTYASILSKIVERDYAFHRGNALVPSFVGVAVTILLERHFPEYVDIGFTARMEERLDQIATGELDWKRHLQRFYFGEADRTEPGLEGRIADEVPRIEFPEIELGPHPETGRPIVVRVGRFGPYLQTVPADGADPISASLPEQTPPADLGLADAAALLERAARSEEPIGTDPESGLPVYLRSGRYGDYVQLGENPEKGSKERPRRASLPKGTDPGTVELADALLWLSLPRQLGGHPEDDQPVLAKDGPYGPYVEWGKERRSLTETDDVYTVGLERALELLAQPRQRRGAASRQVLREFQTPEGKVELLHGRFGPYLTDGKKNASLRKGEDPAQLTEEDATRILGERGKAPQRRRR